MIRSVFWNAWNLAALAATATAATVLHDPWVAGAGLAAEFAWLAIGSGSARRSANQLGRDRIKRREKSVQATRDELSLLPAHERAVAQQVATAAAEVRAECERNPLLAQALLSPDLDRLEVTVAQYVHLALVVHRCDTYLSRADAGRIANERDDWKRQADAALDESAKTLATRNSEVLDRRLAMIDEIRSFSARARGQMALVQNTVALLRDQAVTLARPETVAHELDSLVGEMDTMREVSRDVEAAMSEHEPSRPPERVRT